MFSSSRNLLPLAAAVSCLPYVDVWACITLADSPVPLLLLCCPFSGLPFLLLIWPSSFFFLWRAWTHTHTHARNRDRQQGSQHGIAEIDELNSRQSSTRLAQLDEMATKGAHGLAAALIYRPVSCRLATVCQLRIRFPLRFAFAPAKYSMLVDAVFDEIADASQFGKAKENKE